MNTAPKPASANTPDNSTVSLLSGAMATRQTAFDIGNFLGLLPDPDPVLQKMGEGPAILESLSADSHLMAVMQTRKNGTLETEFEVKAGSAKDAEPTPQAQALADALKEDLWKMGLRDVISQVLESTLYGMTPCELLWEARDGMVRLKEIRPLPARWFAYDMDNAARFLTASSPYLGVPLPEGKFVISRHHPSYDNPYGIRLLSRVFWPIFFKRNTLKFWVEFLEKFGGAFLIGKYQNPADAPGMLAQLTAMIRSSVAVVPAGAEVDAIVTNSTGTSDAFERFKNSMDSEISKVILGQTLTTEVGDKGTQALGTVHKTVLDSYVTADKALVKAFFDEVAWLYGQINDATASSPVLEWEQEEDEKNTLATRDKTLADTGMLRFKKPYFVRKYNFEEGDIEEVEKQTPPAMIPDANAKQQPREDPLNPSSNFSESGFPDQDAMDRFIESIPDGAMQGIAADALKPIIAAVTEGKTFEQTMEAIAKAYPEMSTDRMEEVLARAMFVSEAWGRLNAAKGQ